MKILITGAAGFIGSHLVDRLVSNAYDCLGVDIYDSMLYASDSSHALGHYENVHKSNCVILPIDLREDEFLRLILDYQPDCIVHLAADSRTLSSSIYDVLRNNTLPMRRILAFSRKSGCRIIYASSASVYGSRIEYGQSLSETLHQPRPSNAYAFSKYQLELLAANHNAIGLRLFNVYGLNELYKGSTGSVASQIVTNYKHGKIFPMFLDSDRVFRDFIYVESVVDIILALIDSSEIGVVNVGTGVARTFMDVYNTIASSLDLGPPSFKTNHVLSGYQHFTKACTMRLNQIAPIHRTYTLEQGISELIYAHGLS
jgi:ADP-L-glycero-D-manno-heptose 6-epimerase